MASFNIFTGIRVLLFLVVCLTIVKSSVGEQVFCGSKLREVVDLMCPMGLNGYKTKRGFPSLGEGFSAEFMKEDFDFGLSFDMLGDMENNGVANLRRRRHGIVDECCDKPCSTQEILSYCKN